MRNEKDTEYYVIYFSDGGDMPYCRVAYNQINFHGEFAPNKDLFKNILVDEKTGLIYDGYSLMANWWDATLFKTEEEALQVLQNNIDTKRIKKVMLRIIKLTIKTDCVYC